jgi:shikimate dehydrogenase
VIHVDGSTRLAAVLGWPVSHSKSPNMLNAAFAVSKIDAVMVPMAVPPEDFAATVATLRTVKALGASVTVPHKLAAHALCHDLSVAAKAIGAVNCLHFDGDLIVGHNTDAGGFEDSLAAAGFVTQGKRALILGAGGSARAVAYGLRQLRAIEVIARRPDQVSWARAWPWDDENLRDAMSRADLVVDCTPTALDPATEPAFVDGLPLDALRPGAWVASLVYHREPLVLTRAKALGHPILDGRGMLLHQAARAFTIWTGRAAPVLEMEAALVPSLPNIE